MLKLCIPKTWMSWTLTLLNVFTERAITQPLARHIFALTTIAVAFVDRWTVSI